MSEFPYRISDTSTYSYGSRMGDDWGFPLVLFYVILFFRDVVREST